MKERLSRAWRAFASVATIFSFVVNLVLVVALILAINPLFQTKNDVIEPLLQKLDRAFVGLGEARVETNVEVERPIGIRFDLPIEDEPLGLDFDLPINQETVVVLTQPTRVEGVEINFVLPAGGGVINGSGSIVLPAETALPVRLDMVVPVERTIPVSMTVPVSQTVPVEMDIPVSIQLGEAGLEPAVQRLRDVFAPLRLALERLPDGIELR
ncbi:MAG: hypothetical protein PVH62_00135 [Anaerolineae bacterium]|jgi:hypothetical protein